MSRQNWNPQMLSDTAAITMKSGSQLVLKFVDTFKHLNEAKSLIEFLTMLSAQMCHAQGTNMATQTPQMDVFPHLATMVCNTEKYTPLQKIVTN